MANIIEGIRKFRNSFKPDFEKRIEREHRAYERGLKTVDTDSPGNKSPQEWSNDRRGHGISGS